MHDVRHRVVADGAGAGIEVHLRRNRVADAQFAVLHGTVMTEYVGLNLQRIFHRKQRQAHARFAELALVADLTAGLGVERCAVEHDNAAVARDQRLNARAVFVERDDAALFRQRLITAKRSFRSIIGEHRIRLKFARSTRCGALLFHRGLEARLIHRHTALTTDIGGQVERKTERVVELKGDRTVECFRAIGKRFFEDRHAMHQRFTEANFLRVQRLGHAIFSCAKLGIRSAHLHIKLGN